MEEQQELSYSGIKIRRQTEPTTRLMKENVYSLRQISNMSTDRIRIEKSTIFGVEKHSTLDYYDILPNKLLPPLIGYFVINTDFVYISNEERRDRFYHIDDEGYLRRLRLFNHKHDILIFVSRYVFASLTCAFFSAKKMRKVDQKRVYDRLDLFIPEDVPVVIDFSKVVRDMSKPRLVRGFILRATGDLYAFCSKGDLYRIPVNRSVNSGFLVDKVAMRKGNYFINNTYYSKEVLNEASLPFKEPLLVEGLPFVKYNKPILDIFIEKLED